MNVTFFLTLGVALLLTLLGLLVVLSTVRKPIKFSFGLLCVTLIAWILSNVSADAYPQHALLFTKLAFAFGALALAALHIFVLYFPGKSRHADRRAATLAVGSVSVALFSLGSYIVPAVRLEQGYADVVTGEWYALYVAYALTVLFSSLMVLVKKMKAEKGLNKERLRYVLWGVGLTATIALTTNLLLPLLTGRNPLAIYGSFATLILIATLTYSIVQHHLFSIRLATTRATAYLLSGIILGSAYGLGIFAFAEYIFGDVESTAGQRTFYTISALALGLLYSPLKTFFDRITQKIFLRDQYDPRQLLTSIAEIATKAETSRRLLEDVTQQIFEQMHPKFVLGYVLEDGAPKLLSHAGEYPERERTLTAISAIYESDHVVITQNEGTYPLHTTDEMGAVVILRTSEGVVGHLTIGYKLNGTTFTKSDTEVLETIAREVAIAVENLLRFEAIKDFNETLQSRIDEATVQLTRSNNKLKSLDETKDEFISMASHQLRTPLTSVKGYLSMVLEGDAGDITPLQRKLLEEAFTSSQRMVYLIADFLNVSRLQTGKFIIERSPVNIAEIIEEEIDQLKATVVAHQLKIDYEKPAGFPSVMLDENKIRQVVMNFLDNAIFYSKAGSTISVTLTKTAHDITYKVKDTGIGVPPDERPHLFTKFFRATNARKARPDGTGIGLFMAKKAVVAHKGAIIFDSTEGKGSTFGFTLPREIKHEPAKRPLAVLRK